LGGELGGNGSKSPAPRQRFLPMSPGRKRVGSTATREIGTLAGWLARDHPPDDGLRPI
jgi:hypothetical protein